MREELIFMLPWGLRKVKQQAGEKLARVRGWESWG
jgi:hypothetical protein